MSKLLEKIKEIRNSVLEKLDAVTLTEDLDNLDSVAVERAQLREKLEALNAAESNELKRIEDEDQERKHKARAKYFSTLTKKIKDASQRHGELTDKANELIHELVGVLIDRELVIKRDELVPGGVNGNVVFDEIKEMREEFKHAHDRVRIDDIRFPAAWWHAVYSHGEHGELIRAAIRGVGSDRCSTLGAVDLSGLQKAVKDIASR